MEKKDFLKKVPSVDKIFLRFQEKFNKIPKKLVISSIREYFANLKESFLQDKINSSQFEEALSSDAIFSNLNAILKKKNQNKLRKLINATGVIVHTNLGRSFLCEDAIKQLIETAASYSNLEFDIEKGKRGERYDIVKDLIIELCGAEDCLVVNNNAAAVFLSLNTLADKKEVIISRAELVEIGGSFRVPDIMAKAGCYLKEIGTSNRTYLEDYKAAVSDVSALFLKVHKSNYKILGFTNEVLVDELVALSDQTSIPVMEDLGSGALIDLSQYNLESEPLVVDSVKKGVDVICFSGDKLLGGPQAGIIIGKKTYIEKIKKNPLTRAFRIDKMTLAALEATLKIYRKPDDAVKKIPTLRMLCTSFEETYKRAEQFKKDLDKACGGFLETKLTDSFSKTGGGFLPLLELKSKTVSIKSKTMSANELEEKLRCFDVPVIVRIEDDAVVLDFRSVQKGEDAIILKQLENMC